MDRYKIKDSHRDISNLISKAFICLILLTEKLVILTIEELLNGKKVQYPMHDDVTFRRAGKVEDDEEENLEIDFTK
jgi:hypothetical protein